MKPHRTFCLTLFLTFGCLIVAAASPLYVLQSNDVDPSAPTSQPNGRWYHWIGVDPVVTHLETGIAVDAGSYAGRDGIAGVLPVDVFVPGCPPRPESLIHGLLVAVGRMTPFPENGPA